MKNKIKWWRENLKTQKTKLKEAQEKIKSLESKLTKTEMELQHVLQDMPVSPFTYKVSPDTSSVDAMEQYKIAEEIKKIKNTNRKLKDAIAFNEKVIAEREQKWELVKKLLKEKWYTKVEIQEFSYPFHPYWGAAPSKKTFFPEKNIVMYSPEEVKKLIAQVGNRNVELVDDKTFIIDYWYGSGKIIKILEE